MVLTYATVGPMRGILFVSCFLPLLLVPACSDDVVPVDPTPHIVQHGDPTEFVTCHLGRLDARHDLFVIAPPGASVVAGPIGAERELTYDPSLGSHDGTFGSELTLIHVAVTWSTGDADLVFKPPPPVVLTPSQPRYPDDITVRWQPWSPDIAGLVQVDTRFFHGTVSDPANVTSVVIPSSDLGIGSDTIEARFMGSYISTGGVSAESPRLDVDYTYTLPISL